MSSIFGPVLAHVSSKPRPGESRFLLLVAFSDSCPFVLKSRWANEAAFHLTGEALAFLMLPRQNALKGDRGLNDEVVDIKVTRRYDYFSKIDY
jgi:hypothetical protein